MKNISVRRQNFTALALLLAGAVLFVLFLNAPLYTFKASVYTKKSSNTFVGDEKYQEVLAEVQAEAARYEEEGFEASISETVTERVNSKGEKTSLVAFSIDQTFTRNLWDFMRSSLPSAHVIRAMLICLGLAVIFAAAGCMGTMDTPYRYLKSSTGVLRSVPVLLILADMVLLPVFVLMNNVTFWRKISLFNEELLTEGKEELFGKIDRFLFGGQMGDKIDTALKNLDMQHSRLLWALLLFLLLALVSAIWLRHGRLKNTILRILLYAVVLVICVVTLYPYYVMLVSAFRSNAETLDMYFLHMFPTKWIWSNLTDIVNRGVPRFLLNSCIIAGGATVLAMLCGIPAAYAMARMDFKGKKAFLGFVIMSQMFSPVVLLIGIAQLMNNLHLYDNLLGLVFVNAAFNQAFAVWLLRGTFIAISPDMELAAKIDGCNTAGSLIHVLIPMAMPGIVTTLIFVFINAWNEYTISTVLISTASNRPITVGITQFSSFNMIEWQYLFAASLLATIPVVILFMAIEKHLTGGLTSGGVKG